MSDSATVVEDDRLPETDPVDNSPDPEPSVALPVDNPPDPEPSADLPDPVKDPLSAGSVSDKLPTADPVPVKVSIKCPLITMCQCLVCLNLLVPLLPRKYFVLVFPRLLIIFVFRTLM